MEYNFDISIRDLYLFGLVYKNESITKAAEILGIPQPSVSRTIKKIEDYYDTRLFERMNQRIIPTDKGKILYDKVLHLVEYYAKIKNRISDSSTTETLRIASSIKLGSTLMPKLIKEFTSTHKNVRPFVKITNQKIIEEKLAVNGFDIAFVESVLPPDTFISQKLGQDELSVVLPLNHPLAKKGQIILDDLMEYPLLLRERGSSSRELVNSVFESRGYSVDPIWESISTDAILKGVINNLGISILPYSLVKAYFAKGKLATVEIEGHPFVHNFYVCYHKDKFLTDSAKELIELSHTLCEN